MSKILAGAKDTFRVEPGSVAVIKGDALSSGGIYWINSGVQDTLHKAFGNNCNVHLGPYGQRGDFRVECVAGSVDVTIDYAANPSPYQVARQMGTLPKAVTGSAYLLSDADHGYLLEVAAACTITIPKGLRDDFSCGWSQESSGVVTFAAAGVTLNSKGGVLASSAQYSAGGVWARAQDTFRLSGV